MATHEDTDGFWWTISAEFTKDGRSRRVPLSPQALRVVEQVRRTTEVGDRRANRERSEWPFPNPKRRQDHIYECQKLAQRVRRNSGVDLRAHDFGRTAASPMTGGGTPRLVISKILNHAEASLTTVHDRRSYDAEKRESSNACALRVSRVVSDPRLVGAKNAD